MAQMTLQPQQMDDLYQGYSRGLYKITGSEQEDDILNALGSNAGADNSASVNVPADTIGSGVDTSTTVSATGSYQAGKKQFTNTDPGFILGVDPTDGLAKLYIGNATQYMNWTGAALVIKGSISASSIDIPDTSTTASFHVDSSGNAWWGATTLAASMASITSAGAATFAGLTVINMKTYTDFETSARFVQTAVGTGSVTFGNQGCTLATGATGTSSMRMLWWITNTVVFANSPTFTCSLFAFALTSGSGGGGAFVGIGNPTVNGSGYTFNDSHPCAGFYIQKSGSTISVYALQQKGDSTNFSQSAALTTIVDNDNLELFLKINGSTSVDYWFRKNGGALSAKTTLTSASVPTSSENYIHFSATNVASAFNFAFILQSASFER